MKSELPGDYPEFNREGAKIAKNGIIFLKKLESFFAFNPKSPFVFCFRGLRVFAVILASCSPLAAQPVQTLYSPAGNFNPIDRLSLSTRAAAMGSAFVAVADDASALLFNPAGLASLTRGEIALHSDLGWVGAFRETAVFGMPTGQWGGVGFAGSYLSYGTLEGRDAVGSLTSSYGVDRIALQAGWGMDLFKELSFGASFRYSLQSSTGGALSVFSPEFGVLLKPFRDFKIGLDYAHSGWGSWTGPSLSIFKAGASWSGSVDPSTKLLLAVGTAFEINSLEYLQVGTEVAYRSTFFLRGGYQTLLNGQGAGGFSCGAGLNLTDFVLDYAYLPFGDLGDTHRFSVIYPFETSAKVVPAVKEKGSQEGLKSGKAGTAVNPTGVSAPPSQEKLIQKKPAPKNLEGGSGLAPEAPGGNSSLTASPADKPVINTATPVTEGSTKENLTVRFNIPADTTAQGETLEAQGHPQAALQLYREAVQEDPQNATAWKDMGNVYNKAGQKAYSLQCYEKYLQLRPDDTTFRVWLEKYKSQKP